MAFYLTIGGNDYVRYVVPTINPQLDDTLNRSKELTFAVYPADSEFLIVTEGQRVRLYSDNAVIFTGYVIQTTEREIVAPGYSGYKIWAESDETLFDTDPMGSTTTFVGQYTGEIVKSLITIAGGTNVITDNVPNGPFVPSFTLSEDWTFSDAMFALCQKVGWRWYVLDHVVYLVSQNDKPYGYDIDDSITDFNFRDLSIATSASKITNDVTVMGDEEGGLLVCDNFVGNGKLNIFSLSQPVFKGNDLTVLLSDNLTSVALNQQVWQTRDPLHELDYGKKAWAISGVSHPLGTTVAYTHTAIELGGEKDFDLGTYEFDNLSVGIAAGLYSDNTFTQNACFVGVAALGSTVRTGLQAIINGQNTGTIITTQVNHRYDIKIHVSADEYYRYNDLYTSATGQYGGDIVRCGGFVTVDVYDYDVFDVTGTPTVINLYDARVTDIPAFGYIGVLNSNGMAATMVGGIRVVDEPPIRVRSTTRLPFSLTIAPLSWNLNLIDTPDNNTPISVLYRTARNANAHVVNSIAIASQNRQAESLNVVGIARTSFDCENIALSYLDNHKTTVYEGTYTTPEIEISGVPQSGRYVNVKTSSTGLFSALVRDVKLSITDFDDETIFLYTALGFAPLMTVYPSQKRESSIPSVDIANVPQYLSDVSSITIPSITGTTINVDMLRAPRGAYEVRSSDSDWGGGSTSNYIGSFSTQTFSLSRVSRADTFYIREHDNGVVAKFVRHLILCAATGYPLLPSQPTTTSTIIVSDSVTYTIDFDTAEVTGWEIRQSDDTTVVITEDFHNEQETTHATIVRATTNAVRNYTNYEFYTKNHRGEYSVVRVVSGSLPAPLAPVITVTQIKDLSVTLTLSTESRTDILSETLEVSTDSGFATTSYSYSQDSQFAGLTFNLPAVGTYYARARKKDILGYGSWTASPPTITITSDGIDLTPPNPPSGVSASNDVIVVAPDGGILAALNINWTASSSSNVASYQIAAKPHAGGTYAYYPAPNVTSLLISGLTPGTSYDFTVSAISTAGIPSTPTSVYTHTTATQTNAPSAITGLNANAGFRIVALHWNHSTDLDIFSYSIQFSTNNISFSETGRAYTNYYVDRGDVSRGQLGISTTYYYRVAGINSSGIVGPYTSSVSATTLAVGTTDIVAGTIDADRLTANSITASQINADAIKTSNYAEDGSGVPTAGAKLQIGGTAIKVVSGGLQVGSFIFSDYWARLLNGLDGDISTGTVILRGNIDTTVRGGAPDINCFNIISYRPLVNNQYILQLVGTPTAGTDNIDMMVGADLEFYLSNGAGAVQEYQTIPVPSRTYYNVGTPSDDLNKIKTIIRIENYGYVIDAGFTPLLYIRARVRNIYGPSGYLWYLPPTSWGGTWTRQSTAPSLGGGSPPGGGGGGGGGSVGGGGCPAPWVSVRLSNGKNIDASDLIDGNTLKSVNDCTFEPTTGSLENVSMIWRPRYRIVLDNGVQAEFSKGHKFAYVNKSWVTIESIKTGDVLIGEDGDRTVISITPTGIGLAVSFRVRGSYTYYAAGLLSHNLKDPGE